MYTAEDLLAVVQGSPDAVAVHDRAAWVNLYSRAGVVNDPVGSRPHRGHDAIERFYDTFIAPNRIVFHVENDIVSGMTVVRDLSLETIMSTGASVNVPMHLRYDLVDEDGGPKIDRLAAHWELAPMILQLLRTGTQGLVASTKLTPQLVSNQGVGGVIGFMSGLRGVGRAGKTASAAALDSISRGERATIPVETSNGIEPTDLRGLTYRKLIAAGRTVSATIEHAGGPGVVFVEFAPSGIRIDRAVAFVGAR